MWTSKNHGRYDQGRLRYPSDLTDEDWALVEPLIPPAKPGGNPATRRRERGRQRPDVCLKLDLDLDAMSPMIAIMPLPCCIGLWSGYPLSTEP